MVSIEHDLRQLLTGCGVGAVSAIEATVLYSCMRFNRLWKVDDPEESLSGTFRGILAGAFPFCAQYIADETQSSTECYWGQFKKSAALDDTDFHHESVSGADFALVLKDERGYLVSLFQAKKTDGRYMKLYRREAKPTKGTWRKSQFLTLVEYGSHLYQVATGNSGGLSKLHWVHYLGYQERRSRCLPLSRLVREYRREYLADKADTVASYTVHVNDHRFVDLFGILLNGVLAASHNQPPWGWLWVCPIGLGSLLPELMKLTDVYVVDEDRAGVSAILRRLHGQHPKIERVSAHPRPAPTPAPTVSPPGRRRTIP